MMGQHNPSRPLSDRIMLSAPFNGALFVGFKLITSTRRSTLHCKMSKIATGFANALIGAFTKDFSFLLWTSRCSLLISGPKCLIHSQFTRHGHGQYCFSISSTVVWTNGTSSQPKTFQWNVLFASIMHTHVCRECPLRHASCTHSHHEMSRRSLQQLRIGG
jgi:hypothetical protein